VKTLKKTGFEVSKSDPCMYYQWKDNKLASGLSWVDDCLFVGDANQVRMIIKTFKS
jgi:hypothetical protein